jgi:hypothetical protein
MNRLSWFLAGIVASAAAVAEADGLAGLDAQLNGTGRIGVLNPRMENQVDLSSTDIKPRAEQMIKGPTGDELHGPLVQTEALGEAELRQTDARVAGCRIEVARRRQVAPAKVAAGSVRLRFIVEPNGRVHEAEAVAASGTDYEVAACAKRILSEWAFGKHTGTAVVVERNYHFPDHVAAGTDVSESGPR